MSRLWFRRLFFAAIVLAGVASLMAPGGCTSVYAQGSYTRIGHVTLDNLAEPQRKAIADALASGEDPSARAGVLWRMAADFERQGEFEAALVAYDELRATDVVSRQTLDEKARWCKARLAVDHRWTDKKLCDAAALMTRSQGLGLFREVARTVRANYVDDVSYRQILRAGFDNLRAAMASKTFADRFLLADRGASKAEFLAALDALDRELLDEDGMSSFGARYYVRRACEESQRTVGLPDGVVISEFIFASAEHLDAYSAYLTHEMYATITDDLEGHFVGLGIEIRKRDRELGIRTVFEGSPAAKAGLLTGDVIAAVDGRRVDDEGLDTVVGRLRGERGTTVEVTVRRDGQESSLIVTRDAFDVPSVRRVTRLGDIGYLHLVGFQKSTGDELRRALGSLAAGGPMAGLVIDLRENPGGLLDAAVDVCSLLMDQGEVVSTRGRGFGQSHTYRVSHWRFEARGDVPLVLLVDGGSASASEIVAGALHDHGRATLVGSRTFGKGVVQSILPVELGSSAVYLTSARFYTPDGTCIDGAGIEPDIVVKTARADFEKSVAAPDPSSDAALAKAVELLRGPAVGAVRTAPAPCLAASH